MAISTYQKPTIYCNLYENTGLLYIRRVCTIGVPFLPPRGVAHPGHRQRETSPECLWWCHDVLLSIWPSLPEGLRVWGHRVHEARAGITPDSNPESEHLQPGFMWVAMIQLALVSLSQVIATLTTYYHKYFWCKHLGEAGRRWFNIGPATGSRWNQCLVNRLWNRKNNQICRAKSIFVLYIITYQR